MKKEWINNYIEENYPEQMNDILLADGFEEAFMGVVEGFGVAPKACYDSKKCLDILVERDGMDLGEALEYMNFNVVGAYVGEYTPVFIFPFDEEWDKHPLDMDDNDYLG
ncbi:MAG: hypothetical protein H8E05_00095 [Bacteroidetes bacterium]|nr:hypothetical protein [Bacteroidota bacterium]